MKGKFLLLIAFAFLIGCKEEDMSPIDGEFNRALLEKYIWKNDILINEVFTDNSSPESYIRSTTLSFTPTQYSHTIKDSIHQLTAFKISDVSELKHKRVSEYWGDYKINGQDSTLILSYRLNNKISEKLNLNADSLVIYSKYKIIHLSENELTLKLTNDSLVNGFNTIMTYKPVK